MSTDHDRVKASRTRGIGHEITRNDLQVPVLIRDFIRGDTSKRLLTQEFQALARRATVDVSMAISGYSGPPVVALNKFKCLGMARRASSNRVVVLANNAFTIGVEVGNYGYRSRKVHQQMTNQAGESFSIKWRA